MKNVSTTDKTISKSTTTEQPTRAIAGPSRSALHQRRKKIYKIYSRVFPGDVAFENLQFPDKLRHHPTERHQPSTSTRSRNVAEECTTNYEVQVENDCPENSLQNVHNECENLAGTAKNCQDQLGSNNDINFSDEPDNVVPIVIDDEAYNYRMLDREFSDSDDIHDEDKEGADQDDSGDEDDDFGDCKNDIGHDEDDSRSNEDDYGDDEDDSRGNEDDNGDDEDDTGHDDWAITSDDTELDENVSKEPEKIFAIGAGGDWSRTMKMKQNVTKLDLVANTIAMSIRGNLTYDITLTMLQSLDSSIVNSGLPRTMKTLWKMLSRNDEVATTRHLYCRICKDYVGEGKQPDRVCACEACGPLKKTNSLSYFLQAKLTPQLRQLFSDPTTSDSLRYRSTRKKTSADSIEDIYDGRKYKKMCEPGGFMSSENNYSLTLNTDGCNISNSSNASAWPILVQINEFPPHARKRHMLLAGVWVDDTHPDLNTFLLPTVKELDSLYREGITWTNSNGTVITSKFATIICTVDSMARPALLNMTLFNGKYGCTFCYAKGDHMEGKGVRRGYHVKKNIRCRTDSEIRQHMQQAFETNEKIFGVKGISVLTILESLDLAIGVVVDSMHNVFLGVVKQHMMYLLFGKADDAWYAGSPNKLKIINARLQKIRPPSKISRKPRPVETMKHWKASEWRNWILYFCLPCLEGIIHQSDLEHLALLSQASYILNSDCIGIEDLEKARSLLKTYVNVVR